MKWDRSLTNSSLQTRLFVISIWSATTAPNQWLWRVIWQSGEVSGSSTTQSNAEVDACRYALGILEGDAETLRERT